MKLAKPFKKKYEKQLLKLLLKYKKTNKCSCKLKKMFIELVWRESKKERYKYVGDNVMLMCEAKAYEDCCRHSQHFNPDKSEEPSLYVRCVIRSSFAGVLAKNCCKKSEKIRVTEKAE